MNCCGQFKVPKFVGEVKVTTNLCFVALVVPSLSWILDLHDMSVLSNIGRVLDDCTVGSNVRDHTLHHLKLWDVPVVNGLVSLSYMSICINYGRLMHMEFVKSHADSVAAFVVNFFHLAKVTEIHGGPDCDEKVSRNSTHNNTNNIVLYITMLMSHNLLQARNALSEMMKTHSRLKD